MVIRGSKNYFYIPTPRYPIETCVWGHRTFARMFALGFCILASSCAIGIRSSNFRWNCEWRNDNIGVETSLRKRYAYVLNITVVNARGMSFRGYSRLYVPFSCSLYSKISCRVFNLALTSFTCKKRTSLSVSLLSDKCVILMRDINLTTIIWKKEIKNGNNDLSFSALV
jgi:hypothetical protein